MLSTNRNGRSASRRKRVQLNQVAKVNGSDHNDSQDKLHRIRTESSDSISFHVGDNFGEGGAWAHDLENEVDCEPERTLTCVDTKRSKRRMNRRFKKLLSSGSNPMTKLTQCSPRKLNVNESKRNDTMADKSNITERRPLDQLPLKKLEVPRNPGESKPFK